MFDSLKPDQHVGYRGFLIPAMASVRYDDNWQCVRPSSIVENKEPVSFDRAARNVARRTRINEQNNGFLALR